VQMLRSLARLTLGKRERPQIDQSMDLVDTPLDTPILFLSLSQQRIISFIR